MRFGKRDKGPLAWGRRTRANSGDEFEPVASEERSALLSQDAGPFDRQGADETDAAATGDPTQRLLTVLGRFEREMLRGKEGTSQGAWSDGAMRQLIQAVEIAAPQGWNDMAEALTETARILQTYEDAGRANECVPFLADSYEILCLMVGDLIVDKVRSGVMRKWRERYEHAIEDLTAAGLQLVCDEESEEQAEPAQLRSPATETRRAAEPVPEPPVEQRAEPPRPAAASLLGSGPERLRVTPHTEPEPTEPEPVEVHDFTDSERAMVLGTEDTHEATDAGGTPEAIEAEPAATASDSSGEHAEQALEEGASAGIAEALKALTAEIGALREGKPAAAGSSYTAVERCLSYLKRQANEVERLGAAEACGAMTYMCRLAFEGRARPTDDFFSLCEDFGPAFLQSIHDKSDGSAQSWADRCREFVVNWSGRDAQRPAAQEPRVTPERGPEPSPKAEQKAPRPVPMSESKPASPHGGRFAPPARAEEPALTGTAPRGVKTESSRASREGSRPAGTEPASEEGPKAAAEEESPQYFLEAARNANSIGDAAAAEVFALRAAERIARAQAIEAERRVREAERRLQEGANAMDAARADVHQAEIELSEAEQRTVETRQRLERLSAEVEEGGKEEAEHEEHVRALDAQLRELQARRDALDAKRREVTESLSEIRAAEADAKALCDAHAEAERQARIRLEDERQRIKNLQRKRTEVEAALTKARELLDQQRAFAMGIGRTIDEIRQVDKGESTESTSRLF